MVPLANPFRLQP